MSRLFSPAGFVLVGLLFLVPFVGISCSAPELGSLDGSFTGFDLAVDADPTYEVSSPVADMVASDQVAMPTPGVPVLAIGVLVVLALGIACALLARPATRLLAPRRSCGCASTTTATPAAGLVLDLSRVDFLAASGLTVLTDTDLRAAEDNFARALVANNRAVLRPLEVLGLRHQFPTYDSVSGALAAISGEHRGQVS